MTDQLNTIYDAIAGEDVTMLDGTVISCWSLDEVKNRISSDHLPIRLMLPPGADGGSAVEGFEYGAYKQAYVTWRVTELMLYQAIARGGGVKYIWSKLAEYIHTYLSAFALGRHITPRATITGFQPQAAVLEWPRGSGNQFHGVQMTVLVRETL